MKIDNIPVEEVQQDPLDECVIVDVRSGAEFRSGTIPGAVNIPLHRLTAVRLRKVLGAQNKVCFLCTAGARAAQAVECMAGDAEIRVCAIEGGMDAWKAAGKPVAAKGGVMSLERQVRIGAGILVLTGILLSLFVHPGWLGLSAFVGGGLVFAGITDSCMMAGLLARMPWNQ